MRIFGAEFGSFGDSAEANRVLHFDRSEWSRLARVIFLASYCVRWSERDRVSALDFWWVSLIERYVAQWAKVSLSESDIAELLFCVDLSVCFPIPATIGGVQYDKLICLILCEYMLWNVWIIAWIIVFDWWWVDVKMI